MVQVIQPRSIAAEIGQAIGGGIGGAIPQAMESRTLREALADIPQDASLEDKMNLVQGLNISPQAKQQAMGGFQALASLRQKQEAQDFKEQQLIAEQEMQSREGEILRKAASGEELSAEDWQSLSEKTRRALLNVQQQQPVFEKESEKLQAQASHKYYEKSLDKAKAGKKLLTEVEIARELNTRGVTGMTARNKAADIFGDWIRDPDAVEFRARSKAFMEGIKELVGGRLSEKEFFFFKGMFPNLDVSEAANEALLGMVELREKANVQEGKISAQIVRENGGRVPPNLRAQVDEKMERYMDNQVDRWKQNTYKAMLREDPPAKGEIAVIDDNGNYAFIPKSQAKAWADSGRTVIGQ